MDNRCWVFNESQLNEALDEYCDKSFEEDRNYGADRERLSVMKFLNSFTVKQRKMVMLPGTTFKTTEVDDGGSGVDS